MLVALTLIYSSCFLGQSNADPVIESDDDEWVYYGFSPSVNYTSGSGSPLNDATWLTVVGYNDSTLVGIYDITGGKEDLLDSFTIDRMTTYTMQLSVVEANFSIERFFKVVSDRPIAAFMQGGVEYMGATSETWGASLFYPSTDGGFAGNEFIIMSAQAASMIRRNGEDYVVFGVDDSDVVVQDADGRVVTTKHVAANSSKLLPLFPSKIYRIVSSGRIMMTSWSPSTFTVTPSPLGGYVGTFFFSNPDVTERPYLGSAVVVTVAQEKSSSVEVIDMDTGSKVRDKELSPGALWFINREEADLTSKHLIAKGSADLVAYAGSTSTSGDIPDTIGVLSHGIFFLGVRPDEPTTFHVPSRGIVFSPESDAQAEVNGIAFTIPKGSYKEIPPGTVTMVSNATLIVEVISNPPTVGTNLTYMRCFGTYLITTEAVEITYPPPKPSEEGPTGGGLGIDMILIGAVVAVVVVAVAVIFVLRKRS